MPPLPNTPDQRLLQRLGACDAARTWLGRRTLRVGWAKCPRATWMWWLVNRANAAHIDQRRVVLAGAESAALVLDQVRAENLTVCTWAVDAARRWAVGKAEDDEVVAAELAARATDGYWTAFEWPAVDAIHAAFEASVHRSAAYSAGSISYSSIAPRQCADVLRACIPWAMVDKGLRASGVAVRGLR